MYISSVKLKDFRCYHRAETTFVHPGAALDLPNDALKNVTLLVGVNGTGKTSILRAVALGVLAPIISVSGYRPYYLVRQTRAGAKAIVKGSVVVDGILDDCETAALVESKPVEESPNSIRSGIEIIHINDYEYIGIKLDPDYKDLGDLPNARPVRQQTVLPFRFVYNKESGGAYRSQAMIAGTEFSNDFSPNFFLLGYGSSRRVEEPGRTQSGTDKSRGRRYLRSAGLFEEAITLSPLVGWLSQLKKSKRFEEVVSLLNQTLPVGTKFSGRFGKDKQPIFIYQLVELPFPALSDGYRSYIGLLGDILCHLHECCPKNRSLIDMTGVVMIDDIEMHLHPKWQRNVVPRLAKSFPNLQFLFSTHSPLVAGSVHAANVRVIAKNQVHQFAERLNGLSVDQILSSPYFDYTPPRSDEAEKQLKALLEGPILGESTDSALEFLK